MINTSRPIKSRPCPSILSRGTRRPQRLARNLRAKDKGIKSFIHPVKIRQPEILLLTNMSRNRRKMQMDGKQESFQAFSLK